MLSITASITATCRVSEAYEPGDGRTSQIRSSSGRMRDLKHSIRYGKAQLVKRGRFQRSGSRVTGTVRIQWICRILVAKSLTALSFVFYHFACLMLLTYKPGPKFAIHNAASLSELNVSCQLHDIDLTIRLLTLVGVLSGRSGAR